MKYNLTLETPENEIIQLLRSKKISLQDCSYQTEKICLFAVNLYWVNLSYVKNQTKEMCLEAIKKNSDALEYVKEQTEKICLEAIKENGFALKFVKNQTEEICLEAVKQIGFVLKFVKNQTKQICLVAIKQNQNSFKYCKIPIDTQDIKVFICKNRNLLCELINGEWVFSIGCQERISKKTFLDRIYNKDGGLDFNPHRQEYLDILQQF